MSTELDAPAVIAVLLILGILLASGIIWYQDHKNRAVKLYPDGNLSAWPIGWVNFTIFICAIITAIFVAQLIIGFVLTDSISRADGVITPELAIAGVVIIQLPLLGVFYGLRHFYPSFYSSRLSEQEVPMLAALKTSLLMFLKYIPIIWISSLIWGSALTVLHNAGLIEELPKQEIVTIFQGGGNLFALVILTLSAVVLAPIAEELIFRGCIYRFLKSQMQTPVAQLISGAIFATIHANLLSFVPLVVVGVILARIYEDSGSIKYPIIFHACFNGFTLMMLFLLSLSNIQI